MIDFSLGPLVEPNHPLWSQLQQTLSSYFQGSIAVVFPEEWNATYAAWFVEIQDYGFRSELRYSSAEIEERLRNEGLLLLFVLVNQQPEIMLLGYDLPRENSAFYIDMIAVRQQGRGIGSVLMKYLMRWAKMKQYTAVVLDTEEINENGRNLRHFYETLGFSVVAQDEDGDLTMQILL